MARSDYLARRAARIERLHERAGQARAESESAEAQARRMADVIPLDQPILVGHHSEKRDRRYRDRIHRTFQRAHEASKQADELERRAAATESNRAIRSDDPDAYARLLAKVADLESEQAVAKAINQAIRSAKGDAAAARANLEALGLQARTIDAALTGDGLGHLGVPTYHLSNVAADIRRLRGRLAELEQQAARPEQPPEVYGEITVRREDNRVRIRFPCKPDEATRSRLHHAGFVFSRTSMAWQRKDTDHAWYLARELAKSLSQPSG